VIVTGRGDEPAPRGPEAAIELEPDVAACAVVAMETASGPEPCAVLAMRGHGEGAAAAIERANQRLAEFQQLRRWVLWPEPDLPRPRPARSGARQCLRGWLEFRPLAPGPTPARLRAAGAFGASSDWLLKLIAEISGEAPHGVGDELRLSEDLQLDSLGRGATGGGSGRAAGDCAAGRAAGRGTYAGRAAQPGGRRSQGRAECVDSHPCDRKKIARTGHGALMAVEMKASVPHPFRAFLAERVGDHEPQPIADHHGVSAGEQRRASALPLPVLAVARALPMVARGLHRGSRAAAGLAARRAARRRTGVVYGRRGRC